MKKPLKLLLVALVSVITLAGCSKVDELNDYNVVITFTIPEHKGETGPIELGEVRVDEKQNPAAVIIPVLQGIHNFPLYIKGELGFANPIDRVTGLDFNDWIKIDLLRDEDGKPMLDGEGKYMFEEPKFYVQALSGLPKEYVIKLVYTSTSDDTSVYPAFAYAGTPDGSYVANIVSTEPGASGQPDWVNIFVFKPTYPFKMIPTFTIGDGATLEGNGTKEYTFADADATNTFKVTARDGKEQTWAMRLREVPLVNPNSEEVSEEALMATSLMNVKIEAVSKGFSVEEYDFRSSSPEEDEPSTPEQAKRIGKLDAGTYSPSDTLVVYIASYGADLFPATISVNPGAANTVSTLGDVDAMVFESYDDEKDFYQIDVESGLARHWVVRLEKYASAFLTVKTVSFTYDPAMIRPRTITEETPNPSPACKLDTENIEIDHLGHKIYFHMLKHIQPLSSSSWKVSAVVTMELSNGMPLMVNALWSGGHTNWNVPFKFPILNANGDKQDWEIIIQDWREGAPDKSDECELLDVSLLELRPYHARLDRVEPIVIDKETKQIEVRLANDDNAYPMSIMFDYKVSPGVSVTTQNNGMSPLVFKSVTDENKVEFVSEDGQNKAEWTVSLIAPPREEGADVTNMLPVAFDPSNALAVIKNIDPETATIDMGFTKLFGFPVRMDFKMSLSYKASSDILDENGAGSFTFSKIEDKTFTVTAQNGDTKTWTLRLEEFVPQFDNWNFERWSSGDNTIVPKGVNGSPYWACANMSIGGIEVNGTSKTDGDAGEGYAVQLKTGSTAGKVASGSLFIGWFNTGNALAGLTDPVVLTFQGMPFYSTKKILGMKVDVLYHLPEGTEPGADTGTLAMELIKWNETKGDFVYHGRRPVTDEYNGEEHPENTAKMVARGRVLVGTKAGTQDGEKITVVTDNQWVKDMYVPLDYSGSYPDFTHMTATFASSSLGDAFKGVVGAIMKVDNVRIIYED